MVDENKPDKVLKAEPKVTIVYRWSHSHSELPGGGGGGGGAGVGIGTPVDGGGVVVDVGASTVTIGFPDGLPTGPVRLPGVEVTVVVEPGPAESGPPVSLSPWAPDDTVAPMTGIEPQPVEEGGITLPLLRWKVPCPGSPTNSIRIGGPGSVILNPKNVGQCGASIYIASLDSNGKVLGRFELLPGEDNPDYHAEPGAAAVMAACAANGTAGCINLLQVNAGIG
jgi:hypothetical protein